MAVSKPQNFVFGAGNLYVAKRRPDGTFAGERYVGETSGFNLSVTVTRVDLIGRDCGTVNTRLESVVTGTDWAVSFPFRDMSFENYAMALGGTIATAAQTVTPGSSSFEDVEQGMYYQLGATPTSPVGIGGVSVAKVTVPVGAVEGEDYTVDLKNGRIYIIPGSVEIIDGEDITVTYTPVVESRTTVATASTSDDEYAIRYQACNPRGRNDRLFIPLASISLSGELAFKGDAFLEGTFDAQILKLDGAELIYIDGKTPELAA